MARDMKGQFTGGEDFLPELPMENYMNVRHVPVVLAGAGGAAGVTVETGLDLENAGDQAPLGVKWVLYGAIFQPSGIDDYVALAAAGSAYMVSQVLRGSRIAGGILARGSDDVVCAGGFAGVAGQEAAHGPMPLPYDLVHPTPVVTKRLSVLFHTANHARLNGTTWTASLFFGFAALSETDRTALLQQSINQ